MDKIARIRQEIERRLNILTNVYAEQVERKDEEMMNYYHGKVIALEELRPFLDTLSEDPVQKFNTDKLQEIAQPVTPHKKPTPEDRAKFMEELHEYAESKKPDKSMEEAAYKYSFDSRPSIYGQVDVIDAFKAGAEWQKSQMPMPEDTVLFNKGVAEGRRLEREDSVECEVTDVGFNYLDLALFEAERLGLNKGDKVKVIVLKEEE